MQRSVGALFIVRSQLVDCIIIRLYSSAVVRPSRNIDELLLKAGRELLPQIGSRALSIRKLAARAGVNLGMFHYHFKTKENFVRALLQQIYEEMFSGLTFESRRSQLPHESLCAAMNLIARFMRDNRRLLVQTLGDALQGDAVARDFLRSNLPRHLAVIASLIAAGQAAGTLKQMPLPQAFGFMAGAVGAPILAGTAFAQGGFLPEELLEGFAQTLLSDAAIAQRVDLAICALMVQPEATSRTGKSE